MNGSSEVRRLVSSGLISKDEYILKGFLEELERMIKVNQVGELELVKVISHLIDNPPLDRENNPRFITIGHIKTTLDQNRENERRRNEDEEYQKKRKAWVKDTFGVPKCWAVQERFLTLKNPTEFDKQQVLDSIREEMSKYQKGSPMYKEWMKAGLAWKEVRI